MQGHNLDLWTDEQRACHVRTEGYMNTSAKASVVLAKDYQIKPGTHRFDLSGSEREYQPNGNPVEIDVDGIFLVLGERPACAATCERINPIDFSLRVPYIVYTAKALFREESLCAGTVKPGCGSGATNLVLHSCGSMGAIVAPAQSIPPGPGPFR